MLMVGKFPILFRLNFSAIQWDNYNDDTNRSKNCNQERGSVGKAFNVAEVSKSIIKALRLQTWSTCQTGCPCVGWMSSKVHALGVWSQHVGVWNQAVIWWETLSSCWGSYHWKSFEILFCLVLVVLASILSYQ